MPQVACEVETVDQLGNMEDLYNSDDFRMYCFKVLPCSKHYSHDWTVCPFAHPGEKARRRDPRVFKYAGVECPHIKEGIKCPRGDLCPFAHNIFECWLHPTRYRTQLCNEPASCKRKVCFFTHALQELREPCNPMDSMPIKGELSTAMALNTGSMDNVPSTLHHSLDLQTLQSLGMANPMSAMTADMMLPSLPPAAHSNMDSLVTALQSLGLSPNSQASVPGDKLVNLLVNLLGEVSQSAPHSLPLTRASIDNHNLGLSLTSANMACVNNTSGLTASLDQAPGFGQGYSSGYNMPSISHFDQSRHTSIEHMMNSIANHRMIGRVSVDNALLNRYTGMSGQSSVQQESNLKSGGLAANSGRNFMSISESPPHNSDSDSYHSRKSTASDVSQAMNFESLRDNQYFQHHLHQQSSIHNGNTIKGNSTSSLSNHPYSMTHSYHSPQQRGSVESNLPEPFIMY